MLHDFSPDEADLVYVRPVDVEDLPSDVRDAADGARRLYALHTPEGQRLAIVRDRDLAFALARQNDLAPVSVH